MLGTAAHNTGSAPEKYTRHSRRFKRQSSYIFTRLRSRSGLDRSYRLTIPGCAAYNAGITAPPRGNMLDLLNL